MLSAATATGGEGSSALTVATTRGCGCGGPIGASSENAETRRRRAAELRVSTDGGRLELQFEQTVSSDIGVGGT